MLRKGLRHRSPVGLLRREEAHGFKVEKFVPGNAEQAFGGPVGGDDAVVLEIVEHDRVGRVLNQQAEALLAGAQRFLGVPAL